MKYFKLSHAVVMMQAQVTRVNSITYICSKSITYINKNSKIPMPKMYECTVLRGITRLDGAREKKQVWRPHVRTCRGLSETNLPY